jgi:hypothetical protein
MTDRLEEIEADANREVDWPEPQRLDQDDIVWLIAEVKRLRAQLKRAMEVVPFGVCPPNDDDDCDSMCTDCWKKYIEEGE